MKTKSDLSDKEWELVRALSPHWFSLLQEGVNVMFPNILNIIALDCFVDNRTGPAVESLRRCVRHLQSGKYRKTPEYEELIQL